MPSVLSQKVAAYITSPQPSPGRRGGKASISVAGSNRLRDFWKCARWPELLVAADRGVPALHRFGADGFLFGRCTPGWNGTVVPDQPLPFDPDEVFENYLFERSAVAAPPWRDAYYRVRPLVPLALRRAVQRWQAQRWDVTRFPRWPVERSLLQFHQTVLERVVSGDPEVPEVPYVAFWPGGQRFTCVLTHDVDSAEGFARIEEIARVERDHGFRSAWFVVPELYPVDWDRLARLVEDGFEVGIHGLTHDGRLFSSRAVFDERLPRINEWVRRSGAVGFRSPATLRCAEWLPEIEVDYDASFFDTDPFEPQPGGTCSWFPFFIGHLVELPYTLPQDFTLFEKLRLDAAAIWIDKLAQIEQAGGMALLLTHPDYLDRPVRIDAYARTLQWVAKRANCWRALPRDVAQWWRARHAAQWGADDTIECAEQWQSWRDDLRLGVIRREPSGALRW